MPVTINGETLYEGAVLGLRERNGYHDSDFYAMVWNGEAIRSVEYATTRFGGGGTARVDATAETVEAARAYVAKLLASRYTEAERRRLDEPVSLSKGERVRFLKKVTFTDKKRGGAKVTANAGETGVVIWAGHFGTFYRNGYNRPDRSNLRVGVKLDDGRVVFCGAVKLGLDAERTPEAELTARAEREAALLDANGLAWAYHSAIHY
jgi:hypothetical protein